MTTSRIASNSVCDDRVDRLADEDRRVVDDAVVHARREALLQPLHRRVHVGRGLERVGARAAGRRRSRRRACCRAGCAASSGSSRARGGATSRQPRDLPVRRRADDDVAELLLGGQPALRVDRELERRVGRRRRRAEHAGRHLDVLLADRADDVARRQLPRRQPVRIEPDAHAVLAGAEDLRRRRRRRCAPARPSPAGARSSTGRACRSARPARRGARP